MKEHHLRGVGGFVEFSFKRFAPNSAAYYCGEEKGTG